MTKRTRNRHRTESIPLFEAELISQEHLNRYVHALLEVEAIRAEAIAEIDAAADGAAAQDIRERAEARILDAIHDNDLTSAEYNQLAGVVALDPELQARVEAKRAALETP